MMSNRLKGLTYDKHSFCSSALNRVQATCQQSKHLRHHTAGTHLRKVIRRTERLRQHLLAPNGYCGYGRAPQAAPLAWSEFYVIQHAVLGTINDNKVPARILDICLEWERSGFMALLHMSDHKLIDLEPPFRTK